MSYIYVITNDVNGKQYVGKTNWTIEKRFKEHIYDSKRKRCEKRPLYSAMNKYGIKHFSIKQLEECDESVVNEREQYWIQKLDTYGSNGYNATLGGDSKHYYNYKELADKYLKFGTIKAVCEYFQCDPQTVRTACKEYNIQIKTGQQYTKENMSKKVKMLPEGIVFNSLHEAGQYLIQNNIAKTSNPNGVIVHIRNVCNGKRENAYKHQWIFV